MLSVREFLKSYFSENQTILEQKYPGLTDNYLLEKFVEYTGLQPDDTYLKTHQDFFDQIDLGTPLEYLTQSKFFYRSYFYVNSDVLIPRSETEILVEKTIDMINSREIKTLAEVGVGSGCISLSIAQEAKNLEIVGTDISEAALKVCQINFKRHQQKFAPSTHVEFFHADKLSSMEKKFEMIVSNPPYIKQSDEVHDQVLAFEPHVALFLPDQSYEDWYRQLFDQCYDSLLEDGVFFMEGHEDHLCHLQELAAKKFRKTELVKDYTQRDRFLLAYK